jgi:beta-aspartyl-peptidase (threonine type)
MNYKIIILVHGGARKKKASPKGLKTLREALDCGYSILNRGRSSLDAVEAAIRVLEDDEEFNAGRGSRLQLDGIARMDASIMEGLTLKAGAVAALERIKNPISAAKVIMEKSPHVLLVGGKAREFAMSHGLEEGDVETPRARKQLEESLKKDEEITEIYRNSYIVRPNRATADRGDTVGAVALDRKGTLASGSSTGGSGSTQMLPGRVGDTPIVGSGIYAENSSGAVSSTGRGESIMRTVLAKEICHRMRMGGSPLLASRRALERMTKTVGGTAGVIVLRRNGKYALVHNTSNMSGGVLVEDKKPIVKHRWSSIQT